MKQRLVMTVIGPDRPGLVDSVASLVAEHGGNWLESRMARLGGQFAGVLRVEVPSGKQEALANALASLRAQGLSVTAHPDEGSEEATGARITFLEVMGQDRPGIVRQISHALANYGVNVEDLHTERTSAAMSGESMFKARAKLSVPSACNDNELRRRLEEIAEDLIVDIQLQEANPAKAASS